MSPKTHEIREEWKNNLKMVLELMYAMINYNWDNSEIVELMAVSLLDIVPLVTKKKQFRWLDEDLMHVFVKFVKLVCQLGSIPTVMNIVNKGVMVQVCEILIQIHKVKPEYLEAERYLIFPNFLMDENDPYEATIFSFFTALVNCKQSDENSSVIEKDRVRMLPECRIILPLALNVLQQFDELPMQAFVERKEGMPPTVDVITNLVNSKSSCDQKLVISCNAIVHLMVAYKAETKWTGWSSDPNGQPIPQSLIFMETVELFFRYHTSIIPASPLSEPKAVAELLANLVAIIRSKRLLHDDIVGIHSSIFPDFLGMLTQNRYFKSEMKETYAETAIELAGYYIAFDKEHDELLLKTILDLEFVPSLVEFVETNIELPERYGGFLQQVSLCLCALSRSLMNSANSPHIIEISHQIGEFLLYTAPIVTRREVLYCENMRIGICANIPNMLVFMAKCKMVDLMALETTSGIFLAYIKALKSSKYSELLCRAVKMLIDISHIRGPAFFSVYVTDHFPFIWKRMRSTESCDWKTSMLQLSLTLLSSTDFTKLRLITDLESLMTDWVVEQEDPMDVEGIRVCWKILQRNQNGPLARYLKKKTGKSKGVSGRGVGLLVNIIIYYLDEDPAYISEYLRSLTKLMIEIAKSDLSNSESILLEDLVSPAMWMLGRPPEGGLRRESDKQVVENVKEFVRVLREG